MRELRRAMGLPWYGGRPRKAGKVLTMAEEARRQVSTTVAALEEVLAPEALGVALESLGPAQQLARVGLRGLRQLDELLSQKLDYDDLKQMRLIGDMALGINRIWMRMATEEFRAQREDNALEKLLEAIRSERAEKKTEDKG